MVEKIYKNILLKTIPEAQKLIKDLETPDIDLLLNVEKDNINRGIMKRWLISLKTGSHDYKLNKAEEKAERGIDSNINCKDISPEIRESLRKFNAQNKANGKSVFTRVSYLCALKGFMVFVNKPLKQVTKDDIIDYLANVKNNHTGEELSENSKLLYKSILKQFFQWLYDMEDRDYPDAVKWMKLSRVNNSLRAEKMKKKIVSKEEIKSMTDACDHPRDKALVMILYESACRIGEITKVKISDLIFDEYGALVLVNGKTGARQIRLIDSIPYLKVWLNHHAYRHDNDAPLFINLSRWGYGQALSTVDGIKYILKNAVKLAGVKRNGNFLRIHPHLLRHSRLTHLANEGYNESWMRKFAGWSADSTMPKVYIHMSDKDVDEKMLENRGLLKDRDKKEKNPLESKPCVFCKEPNPSENKLCLKCARPLDIKVIRKMEERDQCYHDLLDIILNDEIIGNRIKHIKAKDSELENKAQSLVKVLG
ncbi:MAG: tyrosine-type recombinase/integrase [Nanoarchaeota archaeon]|nr:tyrosine-type recombinase/integrase [Nanoarchaeota archaeon]